MSKIILAFLLFISNSGENISLEKSYKSNNSSKLPTFISYIKNQPPDSLRDFIKAYLQLKKVEVLNWDGVMSLFQQEMQSGIFELVSSGKMNSMSEAKVAEFGKSLKPVCNILGMRIFNDTTISNNFVIDSIHWHIGSLPVKEINTINRIFVPTPESKGEPIYVLKVFADCVLESKLLK